MVLFSKKLAEILGWEGPALTFGWYIISGIVIRAISPAFGTLTAIEQRLEGDYRACHSELLNHSEEIAFYNGNDWEKEQINKRFDVLHRHLERILYKKFKMGILDSMLAKYGAVMVGYSVIGLPVFGPKAAEYAAKIGTD